MNRPPEVFIRVDEERLLNFSIACFDKVGITHEHAALISRLLVNSDLRGVRSHGTRAIDGYCVGFENGSLNPHPNIRIINETPTAVVLDGNGTLGYLPMVRDVRETYEPMPGTDRALLPGAIEIEHAEQHRREGIRYGEMEQEAARVVSERLGVPLPWDE